MRAPAQAFGTTNAIARSIRKKLKWFLADSQGAAVVEFALVLPLLLLIFFGLIGWGYTLTITDNMYDAARQAARELAVGTSDEVQAKASAESILAAWPATFNVVAQDSDTTGTTDIRVTITAANVMAGSLSFLPMAPTLTASVVMRAE